MMNHKRWRHAILGSGLIALTMLAAVAVTWAMPVGWAMAQQEDARAALKTRFEQRRARLLELKNQGSIGETFKGYVDFVKQPVEQELVQAENADRQTLYEMIAKEQNLTVAEVEKRGAKRHFDRAESGHWLKYPSGQWKQKA